MYRAWRGRLPHLRGCCDLHLTCILLKDSVKASERGLLGLPEIKSRVVQYFYLNEEVQEVFRDLDSWRGLSRFSGVKTWRLLFVLGIFMPGFICRL